MTRAPETFLESRYHLLQPLGQGGMGEVFCALDRLSGTQVALKRVSLRSGSSTASPERLKPVPPVFVDQATLAALDPVALGGATLESPRVYVHTDARSDALRFALAQEFRTLASLRHPNIISVLDYGFDTERQPYFTMELLSSARPLLDAATELALPQKVSLLAQILLALSYLHRRGVLHRDLKPSNILVITSPGEEVPQVKVLDFGLAVADTRQRLRAEVAGTLGYIAPEVLLGGPPSEASDLYSVGVIACEVLTGRDPFDAPDDDQLLRRVIEREPSRERLAPLGELGAFIARLLTRAPDDRFASAAAALSALAAASGQALGTETAAVRESFLQAAPFIGRDSDWSTAQRHLEGLMGAGAGGCLLIMGESGVGKSRFLDELRARALVRGARVVRGQAISSGGGAYHALRDALPPLCLSAVLSDADAGVLKALVPNLPALLQRPIPDAPTVDAQAAQLRLLNSFEALLNAQSTPTVLLLEDLQWADAESLDLLRRGLAVAQTRPLLFVGTARIEERPQLAEELSVTTLLRLQRLPPDDIADLCRSMLGTTPPASLVGLVERETEGNLSSTQFSATGGVLQRGGVGLLDRGGLV